MLEEAHDGEELIQRVAALDVGKAELVCCVRVPSPQAPGKQLQEALIPSLASSPLIRRHPHRGFSRPIRRMSSCTSDATGGLPPGDRCR